MNLVFIKYKKLAVPALLLAVTIFFTDLFISRNVNIDVLYVAVVLITIWIPGRKITLVSGYFVSLLSIISIVRLFTLQPFPAISLINHTISFLGIWAAVWFVISMKLKEKDKQKNEERLDALFEYATEGFLITNSRGEIVMANPAALRQFGYEKTEMIGMKVESLIPQRFAQSHPEYRKTYYHVPKSRSMGVGLNLSAKKKDGSEFPVEISLSSFYTDEGMFVIAFVVDISERKKDEESIAKNVEEIQKLNSQLETLVEERTTELAEAIRKLERTNQNLQENIKEKVIAEIALKESQKLYTAMAHNFPRGLIAVLDLAHNIVFIDGKELENQKLSLHELMNKPFIRSLKLNTPDLKNNLDKAFAGEQVGLETSINKEIYFMNAVPLANSQGEILQVLVVMLNITPRKRAEEEIRNALEKEKVLNELKSRFVSMASHEFRTPLSAILSSVSLIGKYTKTEEQEKRNKHIHRIQSSVKIMNDILNDILSLGKLEEGKVESHPSVFELQELLDELVDNFSLVLKSGQKIQLTYPRNDGTIVTDKNLLRNILTNLLSNAVKYSPEDSAIELNINNNDSELAIEVKDYGMGIPDEDQTHLFERFFRANNASNIQGTGLGLNIVKKYVQLLGGRMDFRSKLNVGSSFYIYLPKQTVNENYSAD